MIALAMVPLIHDRHGIVTEVWLTGSVVVWTLCALGLLGYLVAAAKPDGEAIPALVMFGMLAGLAWPAVAFLPVVGLVFGLRWLVHGPRPSLSRAGRRDARIRRRDERIAELERELEL